MWEGIYKNLKPGSVISWNFWRVVLFLDTIIYYYLFIIAYLVPNLYCDSSVASATHKSWSFILCLHVLSG